MPHARLYCDFVHQLARRSMGGWRKPNTLLHPPIGVVYICLCSHTKQMQPQRTVSVNVLPVDRREDLQKQFDGEERGFLYGLASILPSTLALPATA